MPCGPWPSLSGRVSGYEIITVFFQNRTQVSDDVSVSNNNQRYDKKKSEIKAHYMIVTNAEVSLLTVGSDLHNRKICNLGEKKISEKCKQD